MHPGYFPVLLWSLLIFASFWGYGELLRRRLNRPEFADIGWGLTAAWGMAVVLAIGGVLMMLHLAKAPNLTVLVLFGAAATLYYTAQSLTISRSTGARPNDLWLSSQSSPGSAMRPAPVSSLLDLNLSLRCWRKVHNNSIEFDGLSYEISPTKRKSVCVLFHPLQRFWVLESPPSFLWPAILASFTL